MRYDSKVEKTPDLNITYKEINGISLPMSVYFPKDFDSSKTYPTVIAIHGGAWYAINKNSEKWNGGYMRHNAVYYSQKGYVAVAFSYRSIDFTPATDVFDLICDCGDALNYIKNNFSFVDTEHTILIGDSAGGHLALALGMKIPGASECAVVPELIIACNPVTDCTCEKWKLCAATAEERKSVSPMYNIKKISSKILLVHGGEDQCVDIEYSRKFFEDMKAVGNDIQMIEFPFAKHAFILFGYRDSDEMVCTAHEAIDEYLAESEQGKTNENNLKN